MRDKAEKETQNIKNVLTNIKFIFRSPTAKTITHSKNRKTTKNKLKQKVALLIMALTRHPQMWHFCKLSLDLKV